MVVEFKKAHKIHCLNLAKLKRQVWETTYKGIYSEEMFDNFNLEGHANKFLEMIKSENIELYVVVFEKKMIGYFAIGKSLRSEERTFDEILLLYLIKEFQGMKIGKYIFDFAIDRLKKKNDSFLVYCNKYNTKAHNFFKKMGCEVLAIDEDNIDKSIPQVKFIYKFKK